MANLTRRSFLAGTGAIALSATAPKLAKAGGLTNECITAADPNAAIRALNVHSANVERLLPQAKAGNRSAQQEWERLYGNTRKGRTAIERGVKNDTDDRTFEVHENVRASGQACPRRGQYAIHGTPGNYSLAGARYNGPGT